MVQRNALLLLAVGAVAQEDNPFSSDGDTTQECYAWAADGQCKANPDYMRQNCKYSCWEWYSHRKHKFSDAPIDKRYDCHAWARSGECYKNVVRHRAHDCGMHIASILRSHVRPLRRIS